MNNQNKPIPNIESLQYKGTPDKPDIKIFVSHRIDIDSMPVDAPFHIPVRCGAIYDKRCYEKGEVFTLGDDTGETVSEKRIELSELTVLYWAWKNIKADYYGLCHYRRYFSFAPQFLREDPASMVMFNRLDEEAIRMLHLKDEAQMRKMIEPYDLVVTKPWDARQGGFKNLYEQFREAPDSNVEDMHIGISVLKKLYPKYAKAADKYMNGTKLYICNLFIMKKSLFEEYANWLFSILEEVEKQLQSEQYSILGARTLGHIGERLFGVFYTYIVDNYPECKIGTLQRAMFENTEGSKFLVPYFDKNNVPIVLSSSDYYAPYLSATLQSLIDHTSSTHNYDIIVLNTDIRACTKDYLMHMVNGKSNISLRFVDITPFIEGKALQPSMHFGVQSFYRLVLDSVCAPYDVVVYLDSDVIVKHDIAELYDVSIGNNYMAAVLDYDFLGQYYGNMFELKKYVSTKLNLKEPLQYFQAGVLLINIKAIKKQFYEGELLDFAARRNFLYSDQDALNVKLAGKIQCLDPKWNVVVDNGGYRVDSIIKHAPRYYYDAYVESRKNPYIIHFSGNEKPWLNTWTDFATDFWLSARKTPFYEVILQRMLGQAEKIQSQSDHYYSRIRQLADKIIPKGTRRREFIKKLLPKDSHRWNFFKKIYYKLGGK